MPIRLLKVLVPILILIAVIITAGSMTGATPTGEPSETPTLPRNVDVVSVSLHDLSLDVAAYGNLELREAIDEIALATDDGARVALTTAGWLVLDRLAVELDARDGAFDLR